MGQVRHVRAAMAVFLTVATLVTGCEATHRSAPRDAATTTAPTISGPGTRNPPSPTAVPTPSHRAGGGNRSSAAAPSLAADWPRDVPIPQGNIIGSTGSNGRWTVLILRAGSAAQVRESVAAFYTAAGFTAISDSVLNKGDRQITLVVRNRDHSPNETDLLIQVSTT